MRLKQNLDEVMPLSQAVGEDLDELWYAYSSLLQTKPRSLHRPLRCKPKVYRQQLYQLGRFIPPLNPGPGADAEEDASDDDAAKAGKAGAFKGPYKALKGLIRLLGAL